MSFDRQDYVEQRPFNRILTDRMALEKLTVFREECFVKQQLAAY